MGSQGPATMAHFHGPAAEGKNAPPVIWLSEKGVPVPNPIKGSATLTPSKRNNSWPASGMSMCTRRPIRAAKSAGRLCRPRVEPAKNRTGADGGHDIGL